jgi:ferredoxin
MKVTVDQDKCIASGQCVLTAPDVFDQRDEDGIVFLPNPTPPHPTRRPSQRRPAGRRTLPRLGHHHREMKVMPNRS